jgi:hypothetical protein
MIKKRGSPNGRFGSRSETIKYISAINQIAKAKSGVLIFLN